MNQSESLGPLGRVPRGILSAWGREERKGGRGVRVLGWGKEGGRSRSVARKRSFLQGKLENVVFKSVTWNKNKTT